MAGDRFAAQVRGVCPVVEVPFHVDETVDEASFARLADHLVGTGVTSVMFPAFASEFHKLSDGERASLLDVLLERCGSRVAVVASVSDDATTLACRTAARAAEKGATAVNLLPPFRVRASAEELRRHVEEVASAIAPVPLILQHAPALTGVPIEVSTIAAMAAKRPNLRMVKVEAVPPGSMITALRSAEPSLPAMVGYGGVMLPDAMRRGAVGVQPGCSITEAYVRVWDLWQAGRREQAEAAHLRLLPYLAYWMQSQDLIVQAEKTISMRRGLIESDTCRHPGRPLDGQELRDLDRFLSEIADLLDGA